MNMNINQLVERLKDVPDSALFGYVQDPKLQVPSVLALAEISRRQQIRAAAPQSQMQGPQPTVAEQVMSANQGIGALPQAQQMAQAPMQMAQAPQMVDQGMASLPLPDTMYGEQSMAAGGIVAFDEGGEVPSYKLGGLTEDDIAYQRALANTYDPTEAGRRVLNYGADILSAPGQLSWMRDPKTGKLVRAYEVEGFMPRTRGFNAAEARKKQSRLAQLDLAEADNITRANLTGKTTRLGAEKEGVRQLVADATRPDSAMMDRMVDIPTEDQGLKTLANTQRGGANTTADTGSGRGQPSRNARGDLVFDQVTVDDAGYAELMPDQRGMSDYAAEFKSELGEDAGRAAMKDRLAKMQATGEKEAERAPWMALAEAGLGMAAGQSQFAIQNIAAGGIRGIRSFAEARDNLRKAEERRFELESKVAQAERAEQLAAINYGADSKRADDQNRRAVGLAKQADKARAAEFNAKGKYDAVKDKLSFDLEERRINQMAQYYNRPPAEIQLIDKLAKESGISFGEAFEKVKFGTQDLKSRDAIAKLLVTADPALADDPKRLAAAVTNYQQAMEGGIPSDVQSLVKKYSK